MRMIEHVGIGAGPSWRPARISLQTRKSPDRRLREALRDPEIRLGQKFTGIAVPRALLAQPTPSRDGTGRCGQGDEEELLGTTAPARDFAGSLRQLVGTLLVDGPPQIETMAEITGLSVRSLQRRLAAECATYSEIVDQARYQAAIRLLEDTDNRITDIGLDLGYADPAHFTRAFKRWAGITPREYRSHQQMH